MGSQENGVDFRTIISEKALSFLGQDQDWVKRIYWQKYSRIELLSVHSFIRVFSFVLIPMFIILFSQPTSFFSLSHKAGCPNSWWLSYLQSGHLVIDLKVQSLQLPEVRALFRHRECHEIYTTPEMEIWSIILILFFHQWVWCIRSNQLSIKLIKSEKHYRVSNSCSLQTCPL